MMFKWQKLGKIFNPSEMGNETWMVEQAQNPYAIEMDSCVRIYFNTREKRDKKGLSRSLPGFIDVDKADFSKILHVTDKPLLNFGSAGMFDEHGVMAASVIKIGPKYYLYYVGWMRKILVPYNWEIGLAVSKDGKIFKRISDYPWIGTSNKEPFLQAGCSAVIRDPSGLYHLFYTSGISWIEENCKKESCYQIMKATSTNGLNWIRESAPLIKSKYSFESQASPTVVYWKGRWVMFFSYRHSTDFRNKERGYKIGLAYSHNLTEWERCDDQSGLHLSDTGWDSEMICYPNLFKYKDDLYIFYCGNDFGREGFGVAKLVV